MTQTGISPAAADAEARIFAKIGWRLMPVLILSYILNYLDRNNVGFAGLTMNQAIGLTAAQLGFGAGWHHPAGAHCFPMKVEKHPTK